MESTAHQGKAYIFLLLDQRTQSFPERLRPSEHMVLSQVPLSHCQYSRKSLAYLAEISTFGLVRGGIFDCQVVPVQTQRDKHNYCSMLVALLILNSSPPLTHSSRKSLWHLQ